ncbi:MAG TPA: ABC transporter ATP-binding protein [Candidimonas sp.]|nr:ABC transporter ATP-binding protein [Candidimonas sp.]
MDDAFLNMRQVSYRYPDAPVAISQVDWLMPAGAFHCLLGRSGCGKSTLLKLAAGLLSPEAGHVLLEGKPVRGPGPATGFVFQTPTLLEWLSVVDNVLLPVSLQRSPNAADTAQARALLEELGLGTMQDRYPHQLSGGQQSRVAIARALLTRPRLLLMDEPFAALDALTREELQDILLAVCRQHGTSVLFVTHDIAEAVYLADRVAVMDKGRITFEESIALARPRPPGLRHSAQFNAICASLRHVMDNTQ